MAFGVSWNSKIFTQNSQTGSGVHVDVTDKEVNTGDYYWGKSAALDSVLNKYVI